jgi:hypothetical protein
MRRHATTAVLAAAVLTAFAALAAILLPASAGAVQPAQRPATVELAPAMHSTATTGSPFLTALVGPGTDLTEGQAAELIAAADRVCEGFTAGVPVAVMSTTLMTELSLTGEEARHLVNTAAVLHCATDAR